MHCLWWNYRARLKKKVWYVFKTLKCYIEWINFKFSVGLKCRKKVGSFILIYVILVTVSLYQKLINCSLDLQWIMLWVWLLLASQWCGIHLLLQGLYVVSSKIRNKLLRIELIGAGLPPTGWSQHFAQEHAM